MDLTAAQFVEGHRFAGGGFHHIRPGDKHVGVLLRHHDEIGERRAVHGTSRTRPKDQRNLGNITRGVAGAPEDSAILRQRGHTLLDASAARIDERHHRHSHIDGHVEQMANLLPLLHTQRAAFDREVLRVDAHGTPVDLSESRDHGGTGIPFPDVSSTETAKLLEASLVEEQIKPLASRVLTLGMLPFLSEILGDFGQMGRLPRHLAHRLAGRCRIVGMRKLRGCYSGHHRPPSFSAGASIPNRTKVSPASTPWAAPTRISSTTPSRGAYT